MDRRSSRKTNYVNRCLKYFLFFSNFLFWLVGLGITAIGVLAYLESGGIQFKERNILSYILNFSIVFIGIGVIIVIISFCGAIGALRENICLLRIFSISIFVIFLIECTLAGLAFYFQRKAIDEVEKIYRDTMIKNYREPGYADNTNFVDWLQKELRCCGAQTFTDWNKNMYFNCSNVISLEACAVPYSCCRNMNNIDKNIINSQCGKGVLKNKDNALRFVWGIGCVSALVSLVKSNVFPIAGAVIGVAIIQLIAIFMARSLLNQIADQVHLLKLRGQI